MTKIKLIAFAFAFLPTLSWANTSFECSVDERFRDGDFREIKLTTDGSGKTTAYFTRISGGRVFPGAPVTDTKDFVVASDMICVISKLDGRVRQCSNPSWSETVFATLISRSEIKVIGKGDVTHNMIDELSIAVKSPVMTHTLTFPIASCVLK